MSGANYGAAPTEKGKKAEPFSLLVPAASLRSTQLGSAAENLKGICSDPVQSENLLDDKTADEKHVTSIACFKTNGHSRIQILQQGARGTNHACTGKVYKGGQAHHLFSLRADIVVAGHLQGHQAPP